ncbi:MAG: general secretion pathway protein GspB [Thiohalomonadales bacterium]
MSYILDALKKSELKRNGEELPSWDTEDVAAVATESTRRSSASLWALLALIPVLFFLIYWVFFQPSEEAGIATQDRTTTLITPGVAQADANSGNISDVDVSEGQDSRSESIADEVTKPTSKNPTGNKKRKTNLQAFYAAQGGAKKLAQKPASIKRRPSVIFSDVPLDMDPANKPRQKASQQIIAAGKNVVTIFELPQHIQKKIPGLIFSGHVYSSDSKKRHIMINGQKIREGDAAEPGIVVDKINAQGAIFKFKGWRFSLNALEDWDGGT